MTFCAFLLLLTHNKGFFILPLHHEEGVLPQKLRLSYEAPITRRGLVAVSSLKIIRNVFSVIVYETIAYPFGYFSQVEKVGFEPTCTMYIC